MKKASFVMAPVALVALALTLPLNFSLNLSPDNGKSILKPAQTNSASITPKVEPTTNPQKQFKNNSEKQLKTNSGVQSKTAYKFHPGSQPLSSSSVKTVKAGSETKTALVPVVAEATKTISFLRPPVGHRKEVVGYYAEDWPGDNASLSSVKKYGNKLSGIAAFSFRLNGNGTLTGRNPSSAVKASHSAGSKALVLMHNYNNGKFDGNLVHTIISDPALRKKTAANILSVIKKGNFDGVNIDLENIYSTDKAMFTRFIKELTDLLHAEGYMVTISVPAKTSDSSGGWGGAFDYGELGKLADRIMLMTYDEHWFGGNPGPVASAGWVEQVIRYTKSRIPGHKVLLGLGVYGYEWDINSGASTRALPAEKALQLAYQYRADIKWDKTAQTPYFNYWPDGRKHVVWFESNNSAAFKMEMVNKYNLAGVAIWRLGFEDAGFWHMISEKFGTVN